MARSTWRPWRTFGFIQGRRWREETSVLREGRLDKFVDRFLLSVRRLLNCRAEGMLGCMTTRNESRLAGLAVGVAVLVWFALGLVVYYVPHLAAYWADTGQPLSLAQRLLLTLARFVDLHLTVYLPALLVGTGAALWWRIHTVRKLRAG